MIRVSQERRKPVSRNIDKTEVAIVGGGLAGLAAACYLAREGREVIIIEKSRKTGGMAETVDLHRFKFNMGAHALYDGSPAMQVLHELGVPFSGGRPGDYKAVTGDRLYLLPTGPLSLLRTGLFGSGEKWQAARVLLALQNATPESLLRVTIQEWLNIQKADPPVRQLVEAAARVTTYTNAPDRFSMGTFVELSRIALKGVKYVDGGWQTLVADLQNKAVAAGVSIMTDCRVESVEHNSGRVAGVRLSDGSFLAAEAVVLAVGPDEASRLVDAGEHPDLSAWARQAVPVKAACMDVALRRLPRPENKVVLGIDRPLFMTAQSEYSKVAPDGQALVYTLKYLPVGEPSDPKAVEAELESWLDMTQPDWRDDLVERRYLPNLTVYNALVTAAQGGPAGRPGPEVPGVVGLYVAGDWVGPAGTLSSASLWSARLAARMILSRQGQEALGKVA
jgi:phytoene dehydrogenase-like protein